MRIIEINRILGKRGMTLFIYRSYIPGLLHCSVVLLSDGNVLSCHQQRATATSGPAADIKGWRPPFRPLALQQKDDVDEGWGVTIGLIVFNIICIKNKYK